MLKTFRSKLQLLLPVFVAATIFLAASFAPRGRAQGNYGDREAAFTAKADKVLKRVRKAVDEDRVAAKKGPLTKERSEVERLSRVVAVDRRPGKTESVNVVVTLTDEADIELKKAGFAVQSRIGNVATLETDVDRLPDLASLSDVRKIFASTYRYPVNDRARQAVGVDNSSGQRVVSQTGHGVVVGIIDTGIDFRHLDFTVPGSGGHQTRIKALLDMTVYGSTTPDPGWNYTLPGQSTVIGHLYTEADINAALQVAKPADQSTDPVKERDKNGHGTHVAGTAAGIGLSSPTVGTYSGIAPEADLIIIKTNRQNDGSATFRTTDMINALSFVTTKAGELNEPFVINMSLGGQLGPHDGTNVDERAIDNLVNAGAGRIVCIAAGNDGDDSIHAKATVPAGSSLELDFNATDTPQFIDLYHANSDRFSVTIARPDGTILGPVAYSASGLNLPNGQASDQFLTVYNANDDKGDSDPSNDQPDIFLIFKTGAPTGLWKITLQDADSAANSPFDAWAVGDTVSFANFVDNSSHLVSSPGTARGAVTVGAYVTRSASQTIGAYAPFTSPGPTADGRQKPEISAPGYYLYSAKSTDVDPTKGVTFTLGSGSNATTDSTHYGGLAGTSMATPVVTGSIALLLQANRNLSVNQVKDLIKTTATHDSFTGMTSWEPHFGFGKLSISAAINATNPASYSVSGHVADASNNAVSGVTVLFEMSFQGTPSTKSVQTDASGNFSSGDVGCQNNVKVTPSKTGYTFNPLFLVFVSNPACLSGNGTANFTAALQPTIFVEDGAATQAVALDSVTLVRGPFHILTDVNFSSDHHTRVILFTSDLGLSAPGPSLTVQAGGTSLTVENVGTVSGVAGLNASYIVVRLPDGLPAGNLPLTVTLNGVASSNTPTISISP